MQCMHSFLMSWHAAVIDGHCFHPLETVEHSFYSAHPYGWAHDFLHGDVDCFCGLVKHSGALVAIFLSFLLFLLTGIASAYRTTSAGRAQLLLTAASTESQLLVYEAVGSELPGTSMVLRLGVQKCCHNNVDKAFW